MNGTIVIAGSIAQKPWYGGHTWVFLQYLLGFRKLGWRVLLLDQLEQEMCRDDEGKPCTVVESTNARYLHRVMQDFNLDEAYALLFDNGQSTIGLSRRDVLERVAKADLLINVMGFLRDPEILSCATKRVFLDIDPGFGQMWQELGLYSLFCGHDHYVTIGENIGKPDCSVPTCGLPWITTRQPVVLDYWRTSDTGSHGFTSIASWRGAYGPVAFNGKTYGLRAHEFRKFATLPQDTGQRFEVALDIHPADVRDKLLLEQNGWSLSDPRTAAGDPAQYQAYVQDSAAEFMVAKNMYVETQSGWFSDRSICYLATGKPVLAQDTGLKRLFPANQGLVTFTSAEEAASGAARIARNYRTHAAAARNIASEYFDSDKVLTSLLGKF